ncbi:MAG: transposase [Gloeocapsa sp. UFS-A4-WI-NPMV-4B04]|jgi:transposase|nr:transposase [Gloeocapsa sp. UFS-A4-WI-NPMV-4B04]
MFYAVNAPHLSFLLRKNALYKPHFNRGLYQERNRIERLINRIKQFRRLATRYEKRVDN